MHRFPVAALLAAVALAVLAPAAHAQLVASAPADGAKVTQGDLVTFSGTGAGGGYPIISILLSPTNAVDANGVLVDAPASSGPSAYPSGDAWSTTWTATTVGTLYWQAQRTDCSSSPCVVVVSAPRRLKVVTHPALIRPAPALQQPAANAQLTLGKQTRFSATDTFASEVRYEVSPSPQVGSDGRFTAPLWSKTVPGYGATAYAPRTAGTFYWHAVRQGCTFMFDFIPGTTKYLDVDCMSRRASAVRAFRATAPAPSLRLGASGFAYKSGSVDFELRCANPPCRVTTTGRFVGEGTGRLPALRRTVTKRKARLSFHTLRPSKGQQRRIAAAVNRRGRLKLVLRAQSKDAFGQTASARKRITLRRPKPPKPRTPKSPERRAAERAVGLEAARRYEIGEDRTRASCHPSGSAWKCTWDTDSIDEPWDQLCWYSGEADARRYGDWWDVRLYDIDDSCIDT